MTRKRCCGCGIPLPLILKSSAKFCSTPCRSLAHQVVRDLARPAQMRAQRAAKRLARSAA